MFIPRHVLQQHPLPPFLFVAAIDYLNQKRPTSAGPYLELNEFALRLGFSETIAAILWIRIQATARIFSEPHWSSVRHFARSVDQADVPLFDNIVDHFISTDPLDANLAYDHRRLLAALLRALPHGGHG